MQEFEVVTAFYTLVPWLSGGFLIIGLLSVIAAAITLGWWVGNQTRKGKKVKLWLAFSWIPLFGIFMLSVMASSLVYYESKDQLSQQITLNTGIEVITFVRGDEHRFVGKKDGQVFVCDVADKSINDIYKVNCE